MLHDGVANGEDSAARAHEKRALLVGFRKTGKTAIKFGKSYDGRGTVSQRESLGRCLKLRARAKLACDATKVNDFNPYREGRNEPGPPAIVSTIKLMQAGFTEVMDTEAMFAKTFAEFQASRLLPPV